MFLSTYDKDSVKRYLNNQSIFNKSIKSLKGIRSTLINNGMYSPFLIFGNALNSLTVDDEFLGFSIEELLNAAMENLYNKDSYMELSIPAYITKSNYDISLADKYENFINKNTYYLEIYASKYNTNDAEKIPFNNYIVLYTITHNTTLAKHLYSMVSLWQDSLYMDTLEKRLNDTANRIKMAKEVFMADPDCIKDDFTIQVSHKTITTIANIVKKELMLDR